MLHLLTARTKQRLLDLLARPDLTPDAKQFETTLRAEKKTFRLRPLPELFESMGRAGTSFNVFVRYYVYDFTVDFELATFAMTQNLISPSGILFYVRNGIAYEDPTPAEIALADRDNDGTIEAGLIYPRIYIYQPDPATYHGGANIVQPIPPPEAPEGELASMDFSNPDNSFFQPLV